MNPGENRLLADRFGAGQTNPPVGDEDFARPSAALRRGEVPAAAQPRCPQRPGGAEKVGDGDGRIDLAVLHHAHPAAVANHLGAVA